MCGFQGKKSLNDSIASFLEFEFTREHVKALLRNAQMREGILARAGREGLRPADVDSLPIPEYAVLYDAACEEFNDEAPVVKTYTVKGIEEPYPVEIIGVRGAYMVRSPEFDDKGLFGTLKEAEACVAFNWMGEAKED